MASLSSTAVPLEIPSFSFVDLDLEITTPNSPLPSLSPLHTTTPDAEPIDLNWTANSEAIGEFADEVNLRSHTRSLQNTTSFPSLDSQLPNLEMISSQELTPPSTAKASQAVSESIRMILAISTAALESEKQRQAMKQKRVELFRLGDVADSTLLANQNYQKFIKGMMDKLDKLKTRTQELIEIASNVVGELTVEGELAISAPGTQRVTLPWFKHWHGTNIPNSEAGQDRDLYLNTIQFLPWSNPERNSLKKEIISQNNRAIATLAVTRGEDVTDALASYPDSFFIQSTEMLDWDKVALIIPRRDASQCRIQWLENDHPGINSSKWSFQESEELYRIVDDSKSTNWFEIAKTLGTSRTAHDCLKVYRNRFERKEFTREEDTLLLAAYDAYGENWQDISRKVGKSSTQCFYRYKQTLDPDFIRGRWSEAEDAALMDAVTVVGQQWTKVAPRIAGRNIKQVAERWTQINPELINAKIWSTQQDDDLLRLRAEGKGWSVIAKFFYNVRSDKQCSSRHALIIRTVDGVSIPKQRRATRKKKREEIPELEEDPDYNDGDFIGGFRILPLSVRQKKKPRTMPVAKRRELSGDIEVDNLPSVSQVDEDLDGIDGIEIDAIVEVEPIVQREKRIRKPSLKILESLNFLESFENPLEEEEEEEEEEDVMMQ